MVGQRALFVISVVTLLLLSMFSTVYSAEQGKLSLKHSFKAPFYFARSTSIPFWEFGGSAVVTEEYVRLTQTVKSQQGWLWDISQPVDFKNWEVEMRFSVGGGGKSHGADGFALWYVKDAKETGPVFGSRDYFTGLGIFFDTFDNSGKGSIPLVMGMTNDGTKRYNPDSDGVEYSIGQCRSSFRNKQPSKARFVYEDGSLTVYIDIDERDQWKWCFSVPVDLPTGYRFGVSAATGGLTDNHDIFSFTVKSLDPIDDREKKVVFRGEAKNEPVVEKDQETNEQVKEEAKETKEDPKVMMDLPKEVPKQNVRIETDSPDECNNAKENVISLSSETIRQLEALPSYVEEKLESLSTMISKPEGFEDELKAILDKIGLIDESIRKISFALNDQSKVNSLERQLKGATELISTMELRIRDLINQQKNTHSRMISIQAAVAEKKGGISTFSFFFFIILQALVLFSYIVYRKKTDMKYHKII